MATEQQEEEKEEEFTFPTFTAAAFSSAVDSPPLWSLSPAASPDHSDPHSKNKEEKEKDQEEYCLPYLIDDQKNDSKRRKSFSCIERGRHGHISISKEDQEEMKKMDMLWEDFNFSEELSLKRSKSSNSSNSDNHHHKYYNMGLSCLQVPGGRGLRLSNKLNGKNNKLLSKQQQNGNSGVVMFIKVLKKLFLMHRHRHINLPRNHRSVHTKRPVKLS